MTVATQQELVERIWARDATVWTGADEDKWLGWLDEPKRMQERAGEIAEFAAEARTTFETFVLLGMGGSSLAPEVLKQTFGAKQLHVLDTTHPAMIRHAEKSLDLSKTMFVVSSKSGGTLETLSHFEYFWEKTGANGEQFVAITDPGSALEQLAKTRSMRVFAGEPTIGGRYSALSPFGIVPAALMGIDIERVLESGERMAEACRGDANPGLQLGVQLGDGWREGRDKVCIAETEGHFGLWAEQLIAESTGKQGKGLVPAPGESPEGPDRQAARGAAGRCIRDRRRVLPLGVRRRGRRQPSCEINPFDQPDVQAAKDKTKEVLASGDDPQLEPAGSLDELARRRRAAELHRDPGFHRPDARARAAAADRPGARDRLRRHARARARAICIPLGSCTRAARRSGSSSRSSTTPVGDPDSGPGLRLRPSDPRAGRGRLPLARRTRAPDRANQIGGRVMQLGMIGLGRMGRGMTDRLREHGHRSPHVRPQRRGADGRLARSSSRNSWRRRAPSG